MTMLVPVIKRLQSRFAIGRQLPDPGPAQGTGPQAGEAGYCFEWADIKQDLKSLQEITEELKNS